MLKDVLDSSVFIRIIRAVFDFLVNAASNSVLIGKATGFFGSGREVRIRYIGVFIVVVLLLRMDFFLNKQLGGAFDFKPVFYVLVFVAALFLITPLGARDVFRNSSVGKLLKD